MRTALYFFFLASVFGTLMRYFFVAEIPILEYKYLLHAHSHVALLGWGYMLVSGMLLFLLIPATKNQSLYRSLYILNVIAGIGMAVFFLYQGYGFYSILFSTFHLLSAYVFSWFFLRDLSSTAPTAHVRFARWSIYWYLVSTLGLWAIAPVSVLLGKTHLLYYMSIQFFLHFQFNGWFTYAILALWIHYLLQRGFKIKVPVTGFWLLQLSLLLTYALSVTWGAPLSLIFYLNALGVVLQAAAFYLIFKAVLKVFNPFHDLTDWTDWLLAFGIVCVLVKAAVQMAVVIPSVATISYTIRNYVIGFIHLIMLGSITLTGAALSLKQHLLPVNTLGKIGWLLLSGAFVLTEIILFGQGTLLWLRLGFVPHYYTLLFISTLALPLAILIILFSFSMPALEDST